MPWPARCLFALLGLAGLAGGPARAAAPALVINRLAVDVDLRADGTATIVRDEARTPTTDTAAARHRQVAIPFNPSRQRLDLIAAYTLKRDGRRVEVDPAAPRARPVAAASRAPAFRDVQEMRVTFPDLARDDTEVLRFRREIVRPLFPGQFFWAVNFPRTMSWQEVEIRIRVPDGVALRAEAVGLAEEVSPIKGGTLHVWRYRRTDVLAEDPAAVSPWDRLPRLLVSTLPDYAALAAAYAAAAGEAAAPTPPIRARADEITAGITDRRAQARAIYEWVSAHIRDVAIDLGAGGAVPRAADEVLASRYGDSQDHAALFAALLAARGIVARTALVNLGTAYRLGPAPTLARLNHAITYLPAFDLYADTTVATAPFGVLAFQEYGKPVVVVGAGPAALRRTPLLPPGLAGISTVTDAQLQLDGAILGTTRTEASGPAAIALRLAARGVQSTGHEAAARLQLAKLGEEGGGLYAFAPPDGFGADYVVNARFQLDPRPGILEGESFAPPLGLPLLVRPGDYFLGPLHPAALPDGEATPCFSGHQAEELRIEVPEGHLPVRLPPDVDIRDPHFTYTARWRSAGQVVSVKRELVAAFDAPLCGGELRRAVAAAMARIRRDQRARLVLGMP